jgi:hypothetical protein
MTGPKRSDLWLARLARMNRTSVFLATLTILLVGFFVPGFWGGLVLLLVVVGLAWLLTRTWAVTPPPMRIVRAVILVVILTVAATKIT